MQSPVPIIFGLIDFLLKTVDFETTIVKCQKNIIRWVKPGQPRTNNLSHDGTDGGPADHAGRAGWYTINIVVASCTFKSTNQSISAAYGCMEAVE